MVKVVYAAKAESNFLFSELAVKIRKPNELKKYTPYFALK
jgi:hypothetical protein